MPIHDWSHIEDGIFHHFHHSWIEEIQRALNSGLLPSDYYALAEQRAMGLGPDVLTLQLSSPLPSDPQPSSNGGTATLTRPKARPTAETDGDFYRRKQKVVAIRHISGHELIAVVEVVSHGNKSSRNAIQDFVDKAAELLYRGIHLLVLDLHPPGPRDPDGIHSLIWEEVSGQSPPQPPKPLTLVSYDAGGGIRAYFEPIAVGDMLPEMPLFLRSDACVYLPLEATYERAVDALPRWWRNVLEQNTRPTNP